MQLRAGTRAHDERRGGLGGRIVIAATRLARVAATRTTTCSRVEGLKGAVAGSRGRARRLRVAVGDGVAPSIHRLIISAFLVSAESTTIDSRTIFLLDFFFHHSPLVSRDYTQDDPLLCTHSRMIYNNYAHLWKLCNLISCMSRKRWRRGGLCRECKAHCREFILNPVGPDTASSLKRYI